MKLNNADNENYPTFTAYIVETPDKDNSGNYKTTDWKLGVNTRKNQSRWHKYYDDWYRFVGVLTSMTVDDQEHNVPPNFEINICIPSSQDSNPIENLQYTLSLIRKYSQITFKGVPRRIDLSGQTHPLQPTDIADAGEIYINAANINSIEVRQPAREVLERQSQHTQSRREEKSKKYRVPLRSRLKWNPVKYLKKNLIPRIIGIFFIVIVAIFTWKNWCSIMDYVTNNWIIVFVGLITGMIGSIIGNIIFLPIPKSDE